MSKRGNRKKPDTIFKLTISAESLEDDGSSDFKLYGLAFDQSES